MTCAYCNHALPPGTDTYCGGDYCLVARAEYDAERSDWEMDQ